MMMDTATSSDDVLPEDLVFQILLWLPVLSLLRFKSVCKSWRTFIESSGFITQHLYYHHHSPTLKDKNYSLIVFNPLNEVEKSQCCPPYVSIFSGNTFEVSVRVDLPDCCNVNLNKLGINMAPTSNGVGGIFGLNLVASCNGIICLLNKYSMDVFLWNPTTKQVRVLPKSPFPYQPEDGYDILFVSLGFGFDAKTNDYKVVRFFILHESHNAVTNSPVEVYNFNNDSWRIIDPVLPVIDFIISDPKAPYRNGTYCWLARRDYPDPSQAGFINDYFILSFDFTNEKFLTMPLPDAKSVMSSYCLQLAILGENIACINKVYITFEARGCCIWLWEIWVLNEYGVKESWTKLCNVGPFSLEPTGACRNFLPRGFSKNKEFFPLIWAGKLCLYDFATQKMKNLQVQEADSFNPDSLEVAVYKESLFSIKRGTVAANSITYAEDHTTVEDY